MIKFILDILKNKMHNKVCFILYSTIKVQIIVYIACYDCVLITIQGSVFVTPQSRYSILNTYIYIYKIFFKSDILV